MIGVDSCVICVVRGMISHAVFIYTLYAPFTDSDYKTVIAHMHVHTCVIFYLNAW